MIAFVGGKQGQGWGIYLVNWDGSGLKILTDSIGNSQSCYFSVAWSPNGQSLGFTYKPDIRKPAAQVCRLELQQLVLHKLTSPDDHCLFQSWLKDGGIAYIQAEISPGKEDRWLCRMSPDGRMEDRLVCFSRYRGVSFQPHSFERAVLSPDGERIAFVDQKTSRLLFSDVQGVPGTVESLELKIGHLVWSPDSQQLAVAGSKSISSRSRDLFVLETETGFGRQVGKVAAESSFNWSPDGKNLATVMYHRGKFEYRVIDVESAESLVVAPLQLPPSGDDWLAGPVWSAGGDRLALIQDSDQGLSIQGFDLETSRLLKLVPEQAEFTQIMYLAAGQKD